MAEEPRYLTPFQQRDFRITCGAVSFIMLLLLICLSVGLLLRSGDDDNNNNRFVERIQNTPTPLAQATTISQASSPSPTQFQAFSTLSPTATPLIIAPGGGSIPGGVPTSAIIPWDPYFPPAPPSVADGPPLIIPTNPPPPPPPSATPVRGYQIVIQTRSRESLYVMNRTSGKPLALAPLMLGDGDGAIQGAEWKREFLGPGQCVSAWKDKGERGDADIDCEEIGPKLERGGNERFWGSDFNVYYNGILIGKCTKDKCSFTIPD